MFYKNFVQTFAIFHYKTNDIKETPIVKLVYYRKLSSRGLISFSDYIFLLTILSTSRRQFEIAFRYIIMVEIQSLFSILQWELDRRRRWNLCDITGTPLSSCNSSLLRTSMIQSKYIRGNILESCFKISSFIGGVKSNVEFTLV